MYNLLAQRCMHVPPSCSSFFSTVEKFSFLAARGESGGAAARSLSLIKGSQLKGTNALATLLICTSLSLKHGQKYGAHVHTQSVGAKRRQKAIVTKYTNASERASEQREKHTRHK
jgi:hypothetical protein